MERNNVMMMMGEVTDADAQGLTIIEDQTGQTFRVIAQDLESYSPGQWVCVLFDSSQVSSSSPTEPMQVNAISVESIHDAENVSEDFTGMENMQGPQIEPRAWELSGPGFIGGDGTMNGAGLMNDGSAGLQGAPFMGGETGSQENQMIEGTQWDQMQQNGEQAEPPRNPESPMNSRVRQTPLLWPMPAPEFIPNPNPNRPGTGNNANRPGGGNLPISELNGVIVQRRQNFLVIRNRQNGRLVRVNYQFAYHFCVRQRVTVRYRITTLSQPPQIIAEDIIPNC